MDVEQLNLLEEGIYSLVDLIDRKHMTHLLEEENCHYEENTSRRELSKWHNDLAEIHWCVMLMIGLCSNKIAS